MSISHGSQLVKSFPELGIACLDAGCDRELRLWYLCRSLDQAGSGWINVDELRQRVADLGICSPRTLRRVLQRGDGTFWHRTEDGRVFLTGTLALCRSLGIRVPGRAVWIPLSAFQTLHAYRSALVQSFIGRAKQGTLTISQTRLATLTGKCRQTVSKYLEGCARYSNAMQSTQPVETLTPEMAREGWYRSRVGNRRILCKRLPSTYHIELESHRFGQRRRAQCSSEPQGPTSPGKPPKRVFYDDKKAADKHMKGMGEEDVMYYRVMRGGDFVHDALGHRLWKGVICADGDILDR